MRSFRSLFLFSWTPATTTSCRPSLTINDLLFALYKCLFVLIWNLEVNCISIQSITGFKASQSFIHMSSQGAQPLWQSVFSSKLIS